MSLGLKHFHAARKTSSPNELWKRYIDRAVYLGGLVSPVFTFPQILKIWAERNAAGVSLTSWVAYVIAAVFWLGYGIVHREKPIIVVYAVAVVADLAVVAGVIAYGR